LKPIHGERLAGGIAARAMSFSAALSITAR
jgi:hypothetical protein